MHAEFMQDLGRVVLPVGVAEQQDEETSKRQEEKYAFRSPESRKHDHRCTVEVTSTSRVRDDGEWLPDTL